MSGGPSRAADELRRAPASPCAACGRETKTVEGVCAECWEPKRPGARGLSPEARRTPIFDFDIDPIWLSLALLVVLAVAVKLLQRLWIGW